MPSNPPTIPVGLATILGVIAAVGQYAGAVLLFLSGDLDQEAVGTLATATATLVTVIYGRMKQADSAIKATAVPPPRKRTRRAATPPVDNSDAT